MSTTDILFAQPSYLSGLASVLDIGGNFTEYNESNTPEEADALAILSDWMAVGKDLEGAIEQYRLSVHIDK